MTCKGVFRPRVFKHSAASLKDTARHSPGSSMNRRLQQGKCLLPCPETPAQGKKQKAKGKISPFPLRDGKPPFTLPPL